MARDPSGGEEGYVNPVCLDHAAATHVGLVRRSNEDSYVAEPGFYAVCDGMGGARAGEVASATACHKLLEVARSAPGPNGLRRAVRTANREIYRMSLADPALQGMGTTMTAALSLPGRLLIAHVGDSRAYLLRGGELEQVTEDHSLVGEMVRRGQLTPEQAAVHPHRSVITRALGTEDSVEPDLIDIELQSGDRLLLCTDGLTGMVADSALAGILSGEEPLPERARLLVQAALEGGGEDNVTVLLLQAEACDEDSAGPVLAAEETVVMETLHKAGDDSSTATPADAGVADGASATPGSDAVPSVRSVAAPAGRRHNRRRAFLGAGAALAAIVLAFVAFVLFNSSVYWVGTAEGQVSLYRGLPYTVLGVDLYDLTEVGNTTYGSLDGYVQERIDQRELMTKEEGMRFVRGLAPATTTSSASSTTLTRSTTTTGATTTTGLLPAVTPPTPGE